MLCCTLDYWLINKQKNKTEARIKHTIAGINKSFN